MSVLKQGDLITNSFVSRPVSVYDDEFSHDGNSSFRKLDPGEIAMVVGFNDESQEIAILFKGRIGWVRKFGVCLITQFNVR